jgi:hypothetical protein
MDLGSHLLIEFFYGRRIWILARFRNSRTENIGTYARYFAAYIRSCSLSGEFMS